jgi:hypothetical protein
MLALDSCVVGAQSLWATPVTPTISLPKIKVTVTRNVENFTSNILRENHAQGETRLGKYSYTLTFEGELCGSSMDFLWKYGFGKYTFSADTPVAGANQHVHQLVTATADKATMWEKGFTLEGGSDGKFYTYDSCVINTITISAPSPGMITFTAEILARDFTEDTTGETYSPPDLARLYDNFQATLSAGIDASEVSQPIESLEWSFNRNMTMKHNFSVKTAAKAIAGERVEITGSFKIPVDATERTAVKDDLDNSDEASILIVFTSDQVVTGSTPYSTTIDMPELKYENVVYEDEESERVEDYTFRVGQSGGSEPITLTNINGDSTL